MASSTESVNNKCHLPLGGCHVDSLFTKITFFVLGVLAAAAAIGVHFAGVPIASYCLGGVSGAFALGLGVLVVRALCQRKTAVSFQVPHKGYETCFDVLIKDLQGGYWTFSVYPSTTVGELKSALLNSQKIDSVESVKLVFLRSALEDNAMKLNHVKVREGSIFHVVKK